LGLSIPNNSNDDDDDDDYDDDGDDDKHSECVTYLQLRAITNLYLHEVINRTRLIPVRSATRNYFYIR